MIFINLKKKLPKCLIWIILEYVKDDILRRAVFLNNVGCIKFFLDNGLKKSNTTDKIFSVAIIKERIKIINLLLKYNIKYEYGLGKAVAYGKTKVVSLLLKYDMKCTDDNIKGTIKKGKTQIIKMLIKIDRINNNSCKYSCSYAVIYNKMNIVALLVKNNMINTEMLMISIIYGHTKICELLLKNNMIYDNALKDAIESHQPHIIKLLLDIGMRYEEGINYATMWGYHDIVKLINSYD